MIKNNHLKLIQRARRMMTPEEIRKHVPVFYSKAWGEHKAAIRSRVKLRGLRQKVRKEEREEALKAGRKVKYSIK